MAARRLKFKAKPLLGLVRRNKDNKEQDEEAVTDFVADNSNTKRLPDTNTSVSKELKNTDSIINDNDPNKNSRSNWENTQEQKTISNNGSTIITEQSVVISNNLKSDINNKIKSFLSGCTLDSDSVSFNDNSKYVNISKNINCSQKDDVSEKCDLIACLSTSECADDNCINRTVSETIKNNIESSSTSSVKYIFESSDKTDKSELDTVQDNNENHNKDTKSSGQRIISRFGKTRLKPVLSNIRTKRVIDTDQNNKDEDHSLSGVEPNTDTLKLGDIEPVNSISSLEQDSCSVSNPTSTPHEASVDKEVTNKAISNESSSEILEINKDQQNIVTNSAAILETSETANNNVVSDISAISANYDESVTEPEDQSARLTVKNLQPNKRQRSKGSTYNNLTMQAMKNFKQKFKNGQIDKSKLQMRDLIFYNPSTNPMPQRQVNNGKKDEPRVDDNFKSLVEERLEEEKVDDVSNEVNEDSNSLPVPQVKVGPDGKIMIDPTSLIIEATGVQKNRETLQKSEVVQENEFSHKRYHRKRPHRSDWSPEETLLFYKALNDLGTDFTLMQSLFPERTRRDLKLKFKKEERKNLNLVDKALLNHGNFDFEALKVELNKDRAARIKHQAEQKEKADLLKKELQLKRKEAAEERKQKTKVKRRSDATREFDDTDTGILRVGKIYETKLKKKSKQRTVTLRTKEESNSFYKDDKRDLFDFRFRNVFDDKYDVVPNGTSSGSSNDLEHSSLSLEDDFDAERFNSKVLVRTRFGRLPKSKLRNDEATIESVNSIKKFKLSNSEVLSNCQSSTVADESVMEFVVISDEGKEKTISGTDQTCYQLFGDPLDMTVRNNLNDSVITECDKQLIVSNVIQKNPISEALQIVEELTTENEINYNLQDVTESNCLFLPSNVKSKTHDDIDDDLTQSTNYEFCEFENINGNSVSESLNRNCDLLSAQNKNCRTIIIETPEQGATHIQIVSDAQEDYILPTNLGENEIQDSVEGYHNDESTDDNSIHSKIHCYPSSDHNYTSLTPKMNSNTSYVIVTSESNAEEEASSYGHSTVIVYPSTKSNVIL